ncbi:MAG: hypothetical protein LDL37_08235 [Asticcacaulis sp.]|uniref:hypothetical protein n=1 Tax=Asticcacaulis sp. TaxID=1872648 RepID=UPI0025BA7F6D|nr:hypothetical protein [Asticcacaulis sp.]MCA1935425.1 hypothetical protein [Asticcacaulis sp.]
MLAIDRCAEALNAGKSDEATQRKCGGAVRFDRLKALWGAERFNAKGSCRSRLNLSVSGP